MAAVGRFILDIKVEVASEVDGGVVGAVEAEAGGVGAASAGLEATVQVLYGCVQVGQIRHIQRAHSIAVLRHLCWHGCGTLLVLHRYL